MRVFRETGLFDETPIEVDGQRVKPLDVTSRLLFPKWKLDGDEDECTVMRVIGEGEKGGKKLRYTYDLFDEYHRDRGESSMARTTGFPCVIVARMLAEGRIEGPGVLPPEMIVREDGVFDHILAELARRDVNVQTGVEEIG
jgi:saccharopine dehydrogenase-like NADP-dependent oxidoreductase